MLLLVPNSWMFHHSQRGCWEKLSRALLTKVTWKLCMASGSTQNDHHNLKTFSPWNKTLLSNSIFISITCSSKQMWAVSFLFTQNKVKSRNASVSERSQICSEKQQSSKPKNLSPSLSTFAFAKRVNNFPLSTPDKPMDNKHNSLNLAVKICLDICPWTLSVPRSSQFSLSFALRKLFASRNR